MIYPFSTCISYKAVLNLQHMKLLPMDLLVLFLKLRKILIFFSVKNKNKIKIPDS